MAITVNNLQISGTSNNQNYIEGDWIQSDSITAMNFSYLSVANSEYQEVHLQDGMH